MTAQAHTAPYLINTQTTFTAVMWTHTDRMCVCVCVCLYKVPIAIHDFWGTERELVENSMLVPTVRV